MAHEFTNIIGQEAKKPTTKGKQRELLLQSIFGWRRCEWRWISGTFAEKGQAMQFTFLEYPFQLSLQHYANRLPVEARHGQKQTDATRILNRT